MIERTLVIIKPEAIRDNYSTRILSMIEQETGAILIKRAELTFTKNLMEEFYSPQLRKYGESFGTYISHFIEKRGIIILYEGEGIIKKIKDFVGKTSPSEAAAGTIRKRFYGHDSLERAMREGRAVENGIHCSDSIGEFLRELGVFQERGIL